MSTNLSIQESLYPELICFGCGHANPHGFHLRSYREGDLTVAEFKPRPEHDNGFGVVNGGIIATVLDCHGAAAVMWEVAQRHWNDPTGRLVPFLTASFEVTLHRPTPLGPSRWGCQRLGVALVHTVAHAHQPPVPALWSNQL